MSQSATFIDLINLLFMILPLLVVLFFYIRWSLKTGTFLYAIFRMTAQLVLVGYALIVIFEKTDPVISSLILLMMLLASGWIALRPLQESRKKYYLMTLGALALGAIPVLALVIFAVVQLNPWYMPRYLIPLASMVFSNAMNCVSLCAERLDSEIKQKQTYLQARAKAFQAAMLPQMNNFFAVGLVSLPGMMTGQILSGVSPLLAARYQIMVMAMVLGAGGISAALYLILIKKHYQ